MIEDASKRDGGPHGRAAAGHAYHRPPVGDLSGARHALEGQQLPPKKKDREEKRFGVRLRECPMVSMHAVQERMSGPFHRLFSYQLQVRQSVPGDAPRKKISFPA